MPLRIGASGLIKIVLFGLFFYASSLSAKCYDGKTQVIHVGGVTIDLTGKFNANGNNYSATSITKFSGEISCEGKTNDFSYYSPLSVQDAYVGFNNGKQWVKLRLDDNSLRAPVKLDTNSGKADASLLNTNFTINAQLLAREPTSESKIKVEGDSVLLSNVVVLANREKTGLFQLVIAFLKWVASLFREWPAQAGDLYSQDVILRLSPYVSTCEFKTPGMLVSLPSLSKQEVLNNNIPGYTAFNVQLKCDSLNAGKLGRDVIAFLSSNNLLDSSNTVLIDRSANSAKGVGLQLVKQDNISKPISISASSVDYTQATYLFSGKADESIDSVVNIPLGVYYYPYQRDALRAGEIKSSATLNIVYP